MEKRGWLDAVLGLGPDWRITRVERTPERKELRVELARAGGGRLRCPHCGEACPGYDTRRREWRNLDAWGYSTFLVCDVPRVRCREHGVVTMQVPWAEGSSRYTAEFEAEVILWLKEASVRAVHRGPLIPLGAQSVEDGTVVHDLDPLLPCLPSHSDVQGHGCPAGGALKHGHGRLLVRSRESEVGGTRTQRWYDEQSRNLHDNHMLGRPTHRDAPPGQLQRLLDWLIEQQVERGNTPKFIVTPSVFVPNPMPARTILEDSNPEVLQQSDSWAAFPSTRSAILRQIVENHIQNVVFLLGDIHCCNVAEMHFTGGRAEHLRVVSVTSSAFYWPFPFADGEPSDFVHNSSADDQRDNLSLSAPDSARVRLLRLCTEGWTWKTWCEHHITRAYWSLLAVALAIGAPGAVEAQGVFYAEHEPGIGLTTELAGGPGFDETLIVDLLLLRARTGHFQSDDRGHSPRQPVETDAGVRRRSRDRAGGRFCRALPGGRAGQRVPRPRSPPRPSGSGGAGTARGTAGGNGSRSSSRPSRWTGTPSFCG